MNSAFPQVCAIRAFARRAIRNSGGVERQATTNESGYYVITNVPPGLYTMTVEAAGLQKFESKENKLDPTGDLVIDASLMVGGRIKRWKFPRRW